MRANTSPDQFLEHIRALEYYRSLYARVTVDHSQTYWLRQIAVNEGLIKKATELATHDDNHPLPSAEEIERVTEEARLRGKRQAEKFNQRDAALGH